MQSNERAKLWASRIGIAMVASASACPAWGDCDWTVTPPYCTDDVIIKVRVIDKKTVVDEVKGHKVIKRQFWSKNKVRSHINRAEKQCKRDKSTCEKSREWRAELSKHLMALQKSQKK